MDAEEVQLASVGRNRHVVGHRPALPREQQQRTRGAPRAVDELRVVHRLNPVDQPRKEELLQVGRKHTIQLNRVGAHNAGCKPLGRELRHRLTK